MATRSGVEPTGSIAARSRSKFDESGSGEVAVEREDMTSRLCPRGGEARRVNKRVLAFVVPDEPPPSVKLNVLLNEGR
jgi:hypothetical protein